MAKLTRRTILLAGVESTYGTPPAMTGADAFLVGNISHNLADLRFQPRTMQKPTIGPLRTPWGGGLVDLSFTVEGRGSGAAYSASVLPIPGVFLRGCGFSQTVDTTPGSETVTYDPVSTSISSLSFKVNFDGLEYTLAGARGTFSMTAEAGGFLMFNFTFKAKVNAVADVALPTPTYNTNLPIAMYNGTGPTFDSYSPPTSSFTIDCGNTVATPPSMSASDSYAEIQIVDRAPTLQLTHQLDTIAAYDEWTKIKAAGELPFTMSYGPAQYTQLTWTGGLQLMGYDKGDESGIRSTVKTFNFVETSGDDEMSILFD